MLRNIYTELVDKRPLSPEGIQWLSIALERWYTSGNWYDLARPFGLRPARRGSVPPRKSLGDARYADKDNNISKTAIGHVAFELKSGAAHPHDVIAALHAIQRSLASGSDLGLAHERYDGSELEAHLRMRRYLRTAIGQYLGGDLTLEQAFGLKRSQGGKAGRSITDRQEIAADVLIECLDGAKLADAASKVGKPYGLGKSQVLKDCWRPHWPEAIERAKQKLIADDPNRRLRSFPWSAAEKNRLASLFKRYNKKLEKAGINILSGDYWDAVAGKWIRKS
jgi:hypothetical protein